MSCELSIAEGKAGWRESCTDGLGKSDKFMMLRSIKLVVGMGIDGRELISRECEDLTRSDIITGIEFKSFRFEPTIGKVECLLSK